jgi:uncharacterized UBP type Zn finger protein
MPGILSRLTGKGARCSHLSDAAGPAPRTVGCEECLATGGRWVHLRLCLTCGHVGCCEQSPGRHAFHHFEDSDHPVIRSHEPDETWRWCWIDQVEV